MNGRYYSSGVQFTSLESRNFSHQLAILFHLGFFLIFSSGKKLEYYIKELLSESLATMSKYKFTGRSSIPTHTVYPLSTVLFCSE